MLMTDATRFLTERRYGIGGQPLPKRWAPWPAHDSKIEREKHPLDFSKRSAALIADIALRVPLFAHIDMNAVMVGFTSSRTRSKYGLQARVTPMRFRDGTLYCKRRGRLYQVQRYFRDGLEQLYIVEFSLPRFLALPFEEKLVTVFHELYHIGPSFDGDIRRHEGRYQFHTHSQKEYDLAMGKLVREYLAAHDAPETFEYLHPAYPELWNRHGGIYGTVLPRPKLVPV
jgi:predicted metallopeptidase